MSEEANCVKPDAHEVLAKIIKERAEIVSGMLRDLATDAFRAANAVAPTLEKNQLAMDLYGLGILCESMRGNMDFGLRFVSLRNTPENVAGA